MMFMVWAFLSVLLGSTGQILLKLGVKGSFVENLLNPQTVAGVVLYGLAFFTWLKVLSVMPLSKAYPFLSLNFVLVTFLSCFILHEPIGFRTFLGTFLCLAGVLVINS